MAELVKWTGKATIQMDATQKILMRRYIGKNGKAQRRFTQECAKTFNNYVPYDTGRLKDMMVELQTSRIIYHAPYAELQYYTNVGMGKQGNSIGGLRGKYWDKRCWTDRGDKIVQTIAEFVGGRSK
ncbi:minor capsid protein [Hathewaya histolytica]|uniref:Minor capsid n=1 Tax=Hathewaya histolytica TaxID=1498 RepID=A0A4U9R6X7_HATHI|nr:minor capsid protein [Hathewaya histolytica]VTQ86979.1 Minor capsid [Hathewaya histolytica]